MLICEYCQIFKNTCSEQNLWTTASAISALKWIVPLQDPLQGSLQGSL